MTETLSTRRDRRAAGAGDADTGGAGRDSGAAGRGAGGEKDDDLAQEDRRYRLALDRAMRLLARREHSVRELVGKLVSKGVDAATAGLVVDDLRGRGLQSDLRFAESFVHGRVGRGQGPVRIRNELSRRGIADEVADQVLAACRDDWLAQAADARRRKFGDAFPQDRDTWNRQARFLAQRGFPSDLIYRLLGRTVD